MEKENRVHRAHCLVVPYPLVGHINPMLQFSKRLLHKGIEVTVVMTRHRFKIMKESCQSISLGTETISDGFDEGGREQAGSMGAYLSKFQQVGSQTLSELIEKLNLSGHKADCVVYDAFLPWVLDVAKEKGLGGAVFFTQSCAVDNIYYHVHQGLLKVPIHGPEKVVIPGLPPLDPSDLPSFIFDFGSYPAAFHMVTNQFSNIHKVDWVLCNTFNSLEEEVVKWMEKIFPLRTVGPAIPSIYLDQQIKEDKEYGFNMFKPQTGTCIEWLNNQPDESVVYVSFGSVAELVTEQIEELAGGLSECGKKFLLVVRESEQAKLPKEFLDDSSSGNGLVVSWCPQLEVLAHRATGCFVTHCGWNSTLEGLSLGVPVVAMPRWTDQTTNAKYVRDVWKIGVRAHQDVKGIVRRNVLGSCIREIMEGDKGKEIKLSTRKWKNLAREAVDSGGTSDRNIDEFVANLVDVRNNSFT